MIVINGKCNGRSSPKTNSINSLKKKIKGW